MKVLSEMMKKLQLCWRQGHANAFSQGPNLCDYSGDGIMTILVIVPMLTNYLGITLIYLTAVCFFPESEGVYVNAKLRIL